MGNITDRDIDCLLRILDYCDRIQALVDRFGDSFENYQKDEAYQDAIKMNLFQIGETVNNLSDPCREEMHDIPWHQMYGMRNVIAHGYERVQEKRVWNTVEKDIPDLFGRISDKLWDIGVNPEE